MGALQGLAGLASAINGGFEGYRDQEHRKTQVAEEQARRDQMDRAERDRKALEQANQDFMKALQGDQPQGGLSQAVGTGAAPGAQAAAQPGVNPGSQPGAQPGTPGAAPSLGSVAPASAQAPGKQLGGSNYSDDALYHAYRARTDALARAGLTDHFMDSFSKTAALGARIRQGKMAGALARLNAGDASGVADLYGFVNDGKTVESAQPVQVQSGSEPAWNVRVRNHDTGETSDQVITKSQLMSGIQAINDPQKAIEIEAERAKTIFGTDEKIRFTNAEQKAIRDREDAVEGTKDKNARSLADLKHKHELEQIAAREREVRTTKGTPSAGDRFRPVTPSSSLVDTQAEGGPKSVYQAPDKPLGTNGVSAANRVLLERSQARNTINAINANASLSSSQKREQIKQIKDDFKITTGKEL